LRILPSCQGDLAYLFVAFRADVDRTTREWVDHWREVGIFRPDVPAALAATLMGGAYNELSLRLIGEDRRPPLEGWLRFTLESFFRAFGSPEIVAVVDSRDPPVSMNSRAAERRPGAPPRATTTTTPHPRAALRRRLT
jgi:hypothetical protein